MYTPSAPTRPMVTTPTRLTISLCFLGNSMADALVVLELERVGEVWILDRDQVDLGRGLGCSGHEQAAHADERGDVRDVDRDALARELGHDQPEDIHEVHHQDP